MKKLLQTLFFFLLVTQICFAQWVQVGLNGESIKDIAVQNSNIFAVTSDNGKVYRSIDSGSNWTIIIDSNAVDVAISSSGRVLMIHDSLPNIYSWENLYYSLDNGNTWVTSNIHEQIDSMFFYLLELRNITVSPMGVVYCGLRIHIPPYGFDGYFVRSTDDGLSWVLPLYNDPPGWVAQGGQLFNFNFDYVITIGEHSAGGGPPDINLSSDNGNTLALLGHSPSYYSQGLGLFSNGNIIVGAEDEYFPNTVYISTDMCSTWSIIATVNSQIKVGISLSSGSEEGMLIGTEDLGVFLFSDEGDSLGSWNEGLTNLNVQALTLDNNGYVYAGTENGVWRRPLSEVTSVEEHQIPIPSSFSLSQNFPNPFNPSTKIKYSFPQTSQVQITVYDVLGNEVELLIDEEKTIGTYELTWNAVDLPSGVYFYQLLVSALQSKDGKVGEYTAVKKMILIK